jgi:hypothetical protein
MAMLIVWLCLSIRFKVFPIWLASRFHDEGVITRPQGRKGLLIWVNKVTTPYFTLDQESLSTISLTRIFPPVPASLSGQSLVSHAGLNVVTSIVDAPGFGYLCEDRLSQFVPNQAFHRPDRILGSLAVMLAGGGEHVLDLEVPRNSQ